MSELFAVPFPEWCEAFVEAEAEGREVELFAAVLGVEVPVRPEGECRGLSCGAEGEPRYVPRWVAWVVLCESCAAGFGAR